MAKKLRMPFELCTYLSIQRILLSPHRNTCILGEENRFNDDGDDYDDDDNDETFVSRDRFSLSRVQP